MRWSVGLSGQKGRTSVAFVDEEDWPKVQSDRWFLSAQGYAVANMTRSDGTRYQTSMHRLLMPCPDGMEIDHVDGDRLNNCRANLRVVNRSQNNANHIRRNDCGAPYKGVRHRANGRYSARLRYQTTEHYLGTFDTAEAAAVAYDQAAVKLFGLHARPNFASEVHK